MTKYVRYDPVRLRYVKVDVPRRQQIGDTVFGWIAVVLVALLVGGFIAGVSIAVGGRVLRFLF